MTLENARTRYIELKLKTESVRKEYEAGNVSWLEYAKVNIERNTARQEMHDLDPRMSRLIKGLSKAIKS